MQNKLTHLFEQHHRPILNMYCTAGYPELNSTGEVMKALQAHGADIIELGMPYSDPLADGPVIQFSNSIALQNGMSIAVLLEQLLQISPSMHIPVILMGYLNPILQFGMEKFCREASAAGVTGLIIPDLPMHEFENEYQAMFLQYGLCFIFLISPETSEARIRKIDTLGSGFIYAVSSSATTGQAIDMQQQEAYLARLKSLQLRNPILVGFGIKDHAGFSKISSYVQGAIIGSAYILALRSGGDISAITKEFVNTIREKAELPKTN